MNIAGGKVTEGSVLDLQNLCVRFDSFFTLILLFKNDNGLLSKIGNPDILLLINKIIIIFDNDQKKSELS